VHHTHLQIPFKARAKLAFERHILERLSPQRTTEVQQIRFGWDCRGKAGHTGTEVACEDGIILEYNHIRPGELLGAVLQQQEVTQIAAVVTRCFVILAMDLFVHFIGPEVLCVSRMCSAVL
jgi:hypothetical protein